MRNILYSVFAFGVPETTVPNMVMGQIASTRARANSAPVYTQADIALSGDIEIERFNSDIEVKRVEEEPGSPPPTLRIARGAAQFALEQNVDEIHVIAARPHLKRVLRDQRKAVEELGADITVKPVYVYNIDWYDRNSTQKRVRSRLAWWPRELILRAMPFSLYKRVAS